MFLAFISAEAKIFDRRSSVATEAVISFTIEAGSAIETHKPADEFKEPQSQLPRSTSVLS